MSPSGKDQRDPSRTQEQREQRDIYGGELVNGSVASLSGRPIPTGNFNGQIPTPFNRPTSQGLDGRHFGMGNALLESLIAAGNHAGENRAPSWGRTAEPSPQPHFDLNHTQRLPQPVGEPSFGPSEPSRHTPHYHTDQLPGGIGMALPGLRSMPNQSQLNPAASVYNHLYSPEAGSMTNHPNLRPFPIRYQDLFGTTDPGHIHDYFQPPLALPPLTRSTFPPAPPGFRESNAGAINPLHPRDAGLAALMNRMALTPSPGINNMGNGSHFDHFDHPYGPPGLVTPAATPGPVARPNGQHTMPDPPQYETLSHPHIQDVIPHGARYPSSVLGPRPVNRAEAAQDWRVLRQGTISNLTTRPNTRHRSQDDQDKDDFRPMSSVQTRANRNLIEEERMRLERSTAGFSPNYEGNHRLERNRSANIPESENCALWLSGLPPNVDTHMLLGSIRDVGRVYATHINPPNKGSGHHTAAAKIIFFQRNEAEIFYRLYHDTGFRLGEHTARVTWNRIRVAQQNGAAYLSRCLQISGPEEEVNEVELLEFFSKKLDFTVDEIKLIMNKDGRNLIEFRFGSYRCQAEAAKMALSKEKPHFRCRYLPDPCAPVIAHYHPEELLGVIRRPLPMPTPGGTPNPDPMADAALFISEASTAGANQGSRDLSASWRAQNGDGNSINDPAN